MKTITEIRRLYFEKHVTKLSLMNKFKISFQHLNRILAFDDENSTATRLLQMKHKRRMKLHDRAKKFIKSMLKENVSPI